MYWFLVNTDRFGVAGSADKDRSFRDEDSIGDVDKFESLILLGRDCSVESLLSLRRSCSVESLTLLRRDCSVESLLSLRWSRSVESRSVESLLLLRRDCSLEFLLSLRWSCSVESLLLLRRGCSLESLLSLRWDCSLESLLLLRRGCSLECRLVLRRRRSEVFDRCGVGAGSECTVSTVLLERVGAVGVRESMADLSRMVTFFIADRCGVRGGKDARSGEASLYTREVSLTRGLSDGIETAGLRESMADLC